MFSDSSIDYWFFGVCNKRTAFCPWRNKETTVFKVFGGRVTRELISNTQMSKVFTSHIRIVNSTEYLDLSQGSW